MYYRSPPKFSVTDLVFGRYRLDLNFSSSDGQCYFAASVFDSQQGCPVAKVDDLNCEQLVSAIEQLDRQIKDSDSPFIINSTSGSLELCRRQTLGQWGSAIQFRFRNISFFEAFYIANGQSGCELARFVTEVLKPYLELLKETSEGEAGSC